MIELRRLNSIEEQRALMRFSRRSRMEFGIVEPDSVHACRGDMFSNLEKIGELIALDETGFA